MFPPTSPILTDLYQLTMAYAQWQADRHQIPATFDLYFRSSPFDLTFTVFAGLRRALNFLSSFHISQSDAEYLLSLLPNSDPSFLQYLQSLSSASIKVRAQREGSLCSPHAPLLSITGPIAFLHLLETPLLNFINFPSLVATNAHRFRMAVGPKVSLTEFGLRRAQGPDGALSASIYSFLGGFNATSNIAAAKAAKLPVVGTIAHSFVQSFHSVKDVPDTKFSTKLKHRVHSLSVLLNLRKHANEGELAAFISYAAIFPDAFLALIDTHGVLYSGVPNFMCVALALMEMGHQPLGVRIDSGNLAELSIKVSQLFRDIAHKYISETKNESHSTIEMISKLKIVVSNDVTVQLLLSLRNVQHRIDAIGVGTHLVTCREQPALGCVYKLAAIGGIPSFKFSEEEKKMSLPGEKTIYRLFNEDEIAIGDLISLRTEPKPRPKEFITCYTRENMKKQVSVTPYLIEELLLPVLMDGEAADTSSDVDCLMEAKKLLERETTSCLPSGMTTGKLTRNDYVVYVSGEIIKLIHKQRVAFKNIT